MKKDASSCCVRKAYEQDQSKKVNANPRLITMIVAINIIICKSASRASYSSAYNKNSIWILWVVMNDFVISREMHF